MISDQEAAEAYARYEANKLRKLTRKPKRERLKDDKAECARLNAERDARRERGENPDG